MEFPLQMICLFSSKPTGIFIRLSYQILYLSISSYGIHPQMSITCRVPETCVKSKEVKKTADSRNELKVHSVSVLYSEKVK